jgi:hypothetical protein
MKEVNGFPNYLITENGDIFNKKGLKLKKQVNIDGYFVVNIYNSTGEYHKRICRLVAEAYLSDYSETLVVNHKDLNKQNDNVSNLEMVTIAENTKHSMLNQPHVHTGNAKISDEDVVLIRNLMLAGKSNTEVLQITRFSKDIIYGIRNGSFSRIPSEVKIPKSVRTISEEDAITICKLLNIHKMPMKVLRELGDTHITLDTIKHIKGRRCWKAVSDIYLEKPSSTIPSGSTLK